MARRPAQDLRRAKASREPRKRFVLFCEGRNTEPAYFKALRRLHPHAIIDIAREAGVPITLAELAVTECRRLRGVRGRDSFEENDEVWAVFDRDDHPRHEEAVELCRRVGVRVARSNPCFEVWLILHKTDYDRPDGRHATQSRLRAICPEHDPDAGKTPDCGALLAGIQAAEARAERQLTRREGEGSPFGVPSTTVFLLTRAIREAAEQSR